MPVSLVSAKIRGIRSFSPDEIRTQTIEFTPLTLIVGANGSGKTTIIESLKYIISGDEPPMSDSRRNFINSSAKLKQPQKVGFSKASNTLSNAEIQLFFHNSKGELCLAKRELYQQGKTVPSVSSAYKIGNRSWAHVHKQDEWCRTIPKLFNLPNHAILNYVILCHQDDNLWCMGNSSSVKQIFDEIFGCEQYKKEIKHIETEIKACKSDIAAGEKELVFNKEKVARKNQIISELESSTADIKIKKLQIETLDDELSKIETLKESIIGDIKKANANTSSLNSLKTKAADILEASEKDLLQNKCNQTELEDNLSSDLQAISSSLNEVSGKYRSLVQKLDTKEALVKKLLGQQARADPMSKDLARVQELVTSMPSLMKEISECPQLSKLNTMIEEAMVILGRLVSEHGQENLNKISSELDFEKEYIDQIKVKIESVKAQERELAKEKSKIEFEYSKVRGASKEAHNKVMFMKNARSHLGNSKSSSMKVEAIEGDIDYIESIMQNCKIFDIVSQLREVKEELSHLKDEMKNDTHLPELEFRLEETRREELKIRDKRSMMIGSCNQLERELERMKAELRTHSHTMSKYAESLGRISCNKIILKDLESLNTCFQDSIINFHNQMILKINEVLKSRWRAIYRGSDIDYIELIDEEIVRGKDKRAFNYYIGMVKSGVKMKMREKSSTGQKALASIILRMTLAELFVKDLAFIALDEPTANLDKRNSESLAEAIGIYVKRRIKSGMNLQWIIITHSEKFLAKLDAQCSDYYKIGLDEHNCSTITKTSAEYLNSQEDEALAD